jgi:hypothetical protein
MSPSDERFRRSPQQDQVFGLLAGKDPKVADWYESAVFQLATGMSCSNGSAAVRKNLWPPMNADQRRLKQGAYRR